MAGNHCTRSYMYPSLLLVLHIHRSHCFSSASLFLCLPLYFLSLMCSVQTFWFDPQSSALIRLSRPQTLTSVSATFALSRQSPKLFWAPLGLCHISSEQKTWNCGDRHVLTIAKKSCVHYYILHLRRSNVFKMTVWVKTAQNMLFVTFPSITCQDEKTFQDRRDIIYMNKIIAFTAFIFKQHLDHFTVFFFVGFCM